MSIKFLAKQDDFNKVPGSIFCYWLSSTMLSHLAEDDKLEKYGKAKQGLSTSDNNRFLRFWHEVVIDRIGFECKACDDTNTDVYRWFPYNKAGKYRKWSAINEYVVNYQYDGSEIKNTVIKKYPYLNGPGFVVKNTDSYFHHGITWNDVATGSFCCRYIPDGYIFADAGPMFFSSEDFVMLAYFNSSVFQAFADIICQGLHYSTGHIPNIPFKTLNEEQKNEVKEISVENYQLSCNDWDSFESSWGFKKHPLL